MKRCIHCGELKPLEDFYRATGMADGHRSDCIPCNLAARKERYRADPQRYIARVKKWQQENPERLSEYRREYRQRPERKAADREGHLQRKYGITLSVYEQMLANQDGCCAICREPRPEERTLHVDHDHETGVIRGLLCFRCNNAIGNLREDYDIFLAAAAYLDRDDELAGLARERVGALSA